MGCAGHISTNVGSTSCEPAILSRSQQQSVPGPAGYGCHAPPGLHTTQLQRWLSRYYGRRCAAYASLPSCKPISKACGLRTRCSAVPAASSRSLSVWSAATAWILACQHTSPSCGSARTAVRSYGQRSRSPACTPACFLASQATFHSSSPRHLSFHSTSLAFLSHSTRITYLRMPTPVKSCQQTCQL